MAQILDVLVLMVAAKTGQPASSFGEGDDFSALDSLEFLDLLLEVEARWRVSIEEGSLAEIASLGALARCIEAARC